MDTTILVLQKTGLSRFSDELDAKIRTNDHEGMDAGVALNHRLSPEDDPQDVGHEFGRGYDANSVGDSWFRHNTRKWDYFSQMFVRKGFQTTLYPYMYVGKDKVYVHVGYSFGWR